MSSGTYFFLSCPTCGRRAQVRVEYLGRKVNCLHCRAEFVAHDGELPPISSTSDSGEDLLQRAEELLTTADEWKQRPR